MYTCKWLRFRQLPGENWNGPWYLIDCQAAKGPQKMYQHNLLECLFCGRPINVVMQSKKTKLGNQL